MRKKALSVVVVALTALNIGLFGLATPAEADTSADWSCGCVYNEQLELEPVCIDYLYSQCPNSEDTSNCEC